MTVNDLLDAMRAANLRNRGDGEGATVVELCAASGMSERRCRVLLRDMIAAGEARVSSRPHTGIDGRQTRVPSYVLLEKPAPKGRAKAA